MQNFNNNYYIFFVDSPSEISCQPNSMLCYSQNLLYISHLISIFCSFSLVQADGINSFKRRVLPTWRRKRRLSCPRWRHLYRPGGRIQLFHVNFGGRIMANCDPVSLFLSSLSTEFCRIYPTLEEDNEQETSTR